MPPSPIVDDLRDVPGSSTRKLLMVRTDPREGEARQVPR